MSNCLSVVSTVHLLDHLRTFVCMLSQFFHFFLCSWKCSHAAPKNNNSNIIKQKKNKSHPYLHVYIQAYRRTSTSPLEKKVSTDAVADVYKWAECDKSISRAKEWVNKTSIWAWEWSLPLLVCMWMYICILHVSMCLNSMRILHGHYDEHINS